MSTTSFPVNPELSAVAIGYKNRDIDLIADVAMPRIATASQFKYTKYGKEDAYTVPDTRVGRKSEPTMVDFGGTVVTDATEDYGLDDLLPNSEIDAWNAMQKPAGAVSPEAKSTSLLTGLVLLDREIRVAAKVFSTSNYVSGNYDTLSGTSQWSDFTNANPLNALLTALDIPLFRPNTVVLGNAAWTKVRQHPALVQAIYGTAQSSGAITRQQLADLLEVRTVAVGVGFANTAKKGQTAAISRVWGKHCALLYVGQDLANAEQPCWGFTAQFGTRVAGSIPAPTKGLRGGQIIRSGESVKEVISATDAGYLFRDVVA
jgi:hypothetical protein